MNDAQSDSYPTCCFMFGLTCLLCFLIYLAPEAILNLLLQLKEIDIQQFVTFPMCIITFLLKSPKDVVCSLKCEDVKHNF